MAAGSGTDPVNDRVLTVPNAISAARLVLIGLFLFQMLVLRADGWAVATLMLSGVSDWADGKLARVLGQSSRLGALLDPAIDRIYMAAVPIAFGLRDLVPWWVVGAVLLRDALLAATLPVLRSRGLTALPVTYIGKAGTFALMSAFPLLLLGGFDALWGGVVLAFGWAFLIWGLGMYLWAFVLYLAQVSLVVRRMPRVAAGVGHG